MITCSLAIAAQTIVVDTFTNRVSAVNIFERITPETFPIAIPGFSCAFFLSREAQDQDRNEGVVVLTIGGVELTRGPYSIDFQGLHNARALLMMNALIIPNPGLLRVSLQVDGTECGYYEIPCEGVTRQIPLPLEPNRHPEPLAPAAPAS